MHTASTQSLGVPLLQVLLAVRGRKNLYLSDLSPIWLCSGRTQTFMPGYGVTPDKKSRNIHPCFLGHRCKLSKDQELKGTWRVPLLGWPGVEADGFLSWEPFRLGAHTCSDSKECWVSKEALGKSSASLYPS